MENLERIITDHPFVKGLPPEHIRLIVGCAANVVCKEGEFLFREGEPADKFYLIRQGRLMIESHIPHRGAISIQTLGEGDLVGWSWLLPPYRFHFDARICETTRLIGFDGKCLREKFDKDPVLGYEIMKKFASVMADCLDATRLQMLEVYGDH